MGRRGALGRRDASMRRPVVPGRTAAGRSSLDRGDAVGDQDSRPGILRSGILRRNVMTEGTETAILAGGCFWGMQDLIRKRPGVISTRVGYSGGDVPNATYRRHGTHAESIEILFDPQQLSFRDLLEFFFQIHDPTTRNRQGNDI